MIFLFLSRSSFSFQLAKKEIRLTRLGTTTTTIRHNTLFRFRCGRLDSIYLTFCVPSPFLIRVSFCLVSFSVGRVLLLLFLLVCFHPIVSHPLIHFRDISRRRMRKKGRKRGKQKQRRRRGKKYKHSRQNYRGPVIFLFYLGPSAGGWAKKTRGCNLMVDTYPSSLRLCLCLFHSVFFFFPFSGILLLLPLLPVTNASAHDVFPPPPLSFFLLLLLLRLQPTCTPVSGH